MGDRIPSRATFEFNIPPLWENTTTEKIQIRIVSKNIDEDSSFPRVVSVVKNTSLKTLTNIYFVALLFDENENLINASKTLLDKLVREESDTLVFTWPQKLTSVVAKIEIIPVEYTVNN